MCQFPTPPIPYLPPNSQFPIPHSPQFPIPYSLLSPPLQHPENRKCAFFRIYANYTAFPYCGAVGAIESANTVGFINNANDVSGYFQRGSAFVSVGTATDSASIQTITPQTPDGAVDALTDGAAVIQEIDDFGTPSAFYYYLVDGSPDASNGAGWYTFGDSGYTYADKTFVRGEGFLFVAPYFENDDGDELGSSFVNAGEVNLTAKTVTNPCSGYFHRANYRPVEMSIQKLSPVPPTDAVDDLTDGAAVIQEIDDFGTPTTFYYYLVDGSPDASNGAGWYTFGDSGYTYAAKTFAPGEGFLYVAPYFEDSEGDELGSALTFAE